MIIGSAKDGLPVILGNLDASAQRQGSSAPRQRHHWAKTDHAPRSPALPLEKTPAAALATPIEKVRPPVPDDNASAGQDKTMIAVAVHLVDIFTTR